MVLNVISSRSRHTQTTKLEIQQKRTLDTDHIALVTKRRRHLYLIKDKSKIFQSNTQLYLSKVEIDKVFVCDK